MTWILIGADRNIVRTSDDELQAGDGEQAYEVPIGTAWSVEAGGFVDIVQPSLMLTIGRFKLLFTQAERIALRQAAAQNPQVADFLDLLAGFTSGVALDDPAVTAAIGQLKKAGLLTADRAAAVLSGVAPPL